MHCALHEINTEASTEPAEATLFGMSLCGSCLRHVATEIAGGASARDLIGEALAGDLP